MIRLCLLAFVAAILPFLLLGDSFEEQVAAFVRQPRDAVSLAGLLLAVLAADIALPVPSSVVVSFAGPHLGFLATVAMSTAGLTVSCELGYWAARMVPHRRSESAQTPTLVALAASRAIPLIAEATIFVAGAVRLPHRQFFPVVVIANALVSSLYAGIGIWGFGAERPLLTLAISIAVPVALSAMVWLRSQQTKSVSASRATAQPDAKR